MTDKEQIIIDGVDVKNCKGIDLSLSPLVKCKSLKFKTSDGGIAGIWCSDHTNCYFKQLARKTQECEELKEKFKKFFGIDNQECWDIAFLKDENARYRKALEEIEQHCNEQNLKYDTTACEILNIINKAKDNTNE